MLSAIRRTWPFDSSCSRTRVMSLEVSPLFYLSPLSNCSLRDMEAELCCVLSYTVAPCY